jgi:putative membrane protein
VEVLGQVLVGVVAVIHVYIVVLEMLLWTTPRGRAAFGTTPEQAEETKVLAANQGLYNGFLVAGLVWGLLLSDPMRWQVETFFLLCVAVAGLYGAATVSRRILLVQTLPAVLALAAVLLGR